MTRDAFGRAAFDAVGPLLLLGWAEVGPRLLSMLGSTSMHQASDSPRRETVPGAESDPERAECDPRPRSLIVQRHSPLGQLARAVTGNKVMCQAWTSGPGVHRAGHPDR